MKRLFLYCFLIIAVFSYLLAVTPTKWDLEKKEDFLSGKLKGVSVSSDGFLSLSPTAKKINSPPEEFYLSLITDTKGNIYLGTGHSGRVYKINPRGNYKLIFDFPEMDVYSLALDKAGNLYAATSPNGKIYKINSKGKREEFFNPDEKYIWDLMFYQGFLLAAVGERGGIYRINKQGEGELFFQSPQRHILCLEKSNTGEIIAGTGRKGLVYKISPTRTPTVLFESPYEEIRTLIIDEKGNIYAGAGGRIAKKVIPETKKISSVQDISITVSSEQTLSSEFKTIPLKVRQPGALYEISVDGRVNQLWQSNESLIYSIINLKNEFIIGTGSEGRIFSVDKDKKIKLLIEEECEQIYLLIKTDSKIYFITNNPSSLFSLSPEQGLVGEYLSKAKDTGAVSSWGKIKWEGNIPSGTSIQFFTRTGNSHRPGPGWSDWSPPYQKAEGEKILNPKARFIQFKAILKSEVKGRSPQLRKVSLFYLQANLAPEITQIKLLPPNEIYLKPPPTEEKIWGLESELSSTSSKSKITPIHGKKVLRKGFQTVTWEANDPNKDPLVYTLFIKEEKEKNWRILKENYPETIFAFETISFPDGIYRTRVKASDSKNNPFETELTGEKISQLFIIDNTPPIIEDFSVKRTGSKLEISFFAKDLTSDIQKVEYLLRPEGWKVIFPVDGICDSRIEQFQFPIPLSRESDNLITIRVTDTHQNIGVFRKLF
ncbi:MAG: hypothetical protein ACE5WD_07610 [Candidatus Aminicenantia bacterium]